ncbi:MAG TPA: spermidine/putrescine ABC transporter substrate-binding protein [Caldilineaceae bacterium]|nr:spermidine/putrescine ABC transporter substrate-binding protein [Caldilineaceae bacterium]
MRFCQPRAQHWLALSLVLTLLLAACSGGAAAPATESAGSTEAATGTSAEAAGLTCPEPSPKVEVTSSELNLFVWTEYIPQEMIDCFEQVYGIKVNRDEYSSNEEMYAKLSAGGAGYDLVQPTDYIVGLMIRQNLLQKLDKEKLPVFANFDPNYLNLAFDPNNEYTVPYQAGTDAIVVNTDAVQNPPAKWEDLWNPEYKGRMVSLDDARAVIGATLLTLGYDVNTTDPQQLEEAKAKLTELMPNIKLFDSDSPKTALIAGDVDLGITWTGEAFLAQRENPAIQFVYPAEGAIVWQDNYAIPADAPHLDAAYAWLNYSLQDDIIWLMLRDFPYTNPNTAALEYAKNSELAIEDADGNPTTPKALYEAYMASNITNTPPEVLQKGHRIEDVGDALPLYDQIWTEVKGE